MPRALALLRPATFPIMTVATLLLAACAGGPQLDQEGREIVALGPLRDLPNVAAPVGLALGQPIPPAYVKSYQSPGGQPRNASRRPQQLLLMSWMRARDDAARSLDLGDAFACCIYAASDMAPIEALEFIVPHDSGNGPEAVRGKTGLTATRCLGSWTGPFRGRSGKMYGGHVYDTTVTSLCYATDKPGHFLLIEREAQQPEGQPGDLYGVVRCADEATLARINLQPVAAAVAAAETALADEDGKAAHAALYLYEGAWTHEFDDLLGRVATAKAGFDSSALADMTAELAQIRSIWQQRPRGDTDEMLTGLRDFLTLRHRYLSVPGIDAVGRDEVADLAGDTAALVAAGRTYTAAICEQVAANGNPYTAEYMLTNALAIDAAADVAQWIAVVAAADKGKPFDYHIWQRTEPARRLVLGKLLRRELGAAQDGAGVQAMFAAIAALATQPTPPAQQQLLRLAADLDRTIAASADVLRLATWLDQNRAALADAPGPAWSDTMRTPIRNALRAAGDAAAKAGEPCRGAAAYLAGYALQNLRWPEPESLRAVVENGSQAVDGDVAAARNLMAPVLARLLPPFTARSPDASRYDAPLHRSPVVEWPMFWQLGLSVEHAADLGPAFAKATGAAPSPLRIELEGDDRSHIVTSETEPLMESGIFLAEIEGMQGLFLPPDLAEEAKQLAAERAVVDKTGKELDAAVGAFNQRSTQLDVEITALNLKVDARTATAGEITALHGKKDALDADRKALNERQRTFNAEVDAHNARLNVHNDKRMSYSGALRTRAENRVRSGVLGWVAARQAEQRGSETERGWLARWLTPEQPVVGLERRASRGHGEALFAQCAMTMLDGEGAKGIGERLAKAFVVACACDPDLGAQQPRMQELIEDYVGKFGVKALFDHAAMVVPDAYVGRFTRALPERVRNQVTAEAAARVRAAAEQQQRSLLNLQR